MKEKTLVIGPSWVGDMVMAQSLFKSIKIAHPDTEIDVLAPSWSRPLTDRMPEIHQGLSMPLQHGELGLKKRYRLARQMRAQYQSAYVLPNSFKSALVPYWAKIPLRIGWRGEWRYPILNDVRVLNKKKYPLMVERFVALAYQKNARLPGQLPKPKLDIQQHACNQALAKHHLVTTTQIIALCPGAEFGSSKRWPIAYYAQVASHFLKQGFQVWIFGSANDKPVGEQISALCQEQCRNLCGDTSLAEAIDLMSCCQCVITNDSGLMHIAAALDKPLVALYGSTSPGFTPPLGEKVRILRAATPCSPCFKRECPLKHHECMFSLSPEGVCLAVEAML